MQIDTDFDKQLIWYKTGVIAKQKGWSNISPFYENATADYFFKCGFDKVPFEEAQTVLKEKISEIFKQDSTVQQTVEELVDNNEPRMSDFLP